jgi:hypothetical protein
VENDIGRRTQIHKPQKIIVKVADFKQNRAADLIVSI